MWQEPNGRSKSEKKRGRSDTQRSSLATEPLKELVGFVDCFCDQEPEGLYDSDHAFPKRPTESDKDSNPIGRRLFCGGIQYRQLIRSGPAKSLIRQIDFLEPLLRFLLEPDVIRKSIGMPYFRLITVCLSYLFERRPRLKLKDPTILVVIAHGHDTKKWMQLRRALSKNYGHTSEHHCGGCFER